MVSIFKYILLFSAVLLLNLTASSLAITPIKHVPEPNTARAAILLEASTGHVIYQKNANQRLAIASTTKLMTAWVVLKQMNLTDKVAAANYQPTNPAEALAGLSAGEPVTVADLLRALLLESASDAAETLALTTSGSEGLFIREMNTQAESLDLKNTHYATPIGLDTKGNYSTASDLAKLTRQLLKNNFFRSTVALSRATIKAGDREIVVKNRNTLVGKYRFINGVKTGHTLDAGYVLVGSGTKDGMTVISVVIGEPSEDARDQDTFNLLSYGLENFHIERPLKQGQAIRSVSISGQQRHKLSLIAQAGYSTVVSNTDDLELKIKAPQEVKGPIIRGERIGTALVTVNGKIVHRVPLTAATNVSAVKNSHAGSAASWLRKYGIWIVLCLMMAGILAIISYRGRRGR